jgi:uncharacterized protein (UPF0332 family)
VKENHHRELARNRIEKSYRNLSVARANYQNGFFDDAASKSYYAIPTSIRALLAALHLDSKRQEGAIALFHQHLVNQDLFPRRFNRTISKLKRLREDIDYGDFASVSKEEAQQEIDNADDFVRTADEVLTKLLMRDQKE